MSNRTASRGTIALVLTQGTYFVLGYLVVVVLARELGPAAYGTYGVIMSVLVWLEQSAKRSVPSAAAKLIAERFDAIGEVGQAALVLNLGIHSIMLVLLWLLAPSLAGWFGIENGAFLFRLAALDLPLYGIYTALQGIYQGQRRFLRLGLSDITYALAKVAGVVVIIQLGISIEAALIVNLASSVVGIGFLLTRVGLRRTVGWQARMPVILAIAAPMALYSVANLLCSSLDVWLLKTMAAEATTVGVYVAALNVARVPGFALSTISQVLLPSVSRAVAAENSELVRHYINQAFRFFLILYLPICLVLLAAPEALMQLIYSSKYAGGGVLLAILVIAHGLWAMQAILAAVLLASGKARMLGLAVILGVPVAVPVSVGLIRVADAAGAAVASGLVALGAIVVFTVLLWRQFGAIVRLPNMARIAGAGVVMAVVSALASAAAGGGGLIVATGGGLLAYGVALVALGEIKLADFATVLPGVSAR